MSGFLCILIGEVSYAFLATLLDVYPFHDTPTFAPWPQNCSQAEVGHRVHLEREAAEQTKKTERENNEQR